MQLTQSWAGVEYSPEFTRIVTGFSFSPHEPPPGAARSQDGRLLHQSKRMRRDQREERETEKDREREQDRSQSFVIQFLSDIPSLCTVLFIRSKSLSPAHAHVKGDIYKCVVEVEMVERHVKSRLP